MSGGKLRGYAAKFNSLSGDLGGFVEVIAPGAFTRTLALGADVRCLFNHDANLVLGRTKAGTLKLSEDRIGLAIECQLPETQLARDLAQQVQRGDVSQMSFAFTAVRESWQPAKGAELPVRTLLEVRLADVSPVTFPAYGQTSVEYVPDPAQPSPATPTRNTRDTDALERERIGYRIRIAELEM